MRLRDCYLIIALGAVVAGALSWWMAHLMILVGLGTYWLIIPMALIIGVVGGRLIWRGFR